MARIALALIPVLLFALYSCASAADTPVKSTMRGYDIISGGESIGDLTVTRKRGKNPGELIVEPKTIIRLSGFMWSFSLTLDSRYQFDQSGVTAFNHTITEDDQTIRVTGKKEGSMVKATIKAQGEDEGNVNLDTGSFDATLEGFPRYLSSKLPIQSGTEVRLLDTAEFEVVNYVIKGQKQGAFTLHGKKYDCEIVTFKTPEGESSMWIAKDELGPFMVQEVGTDADGPYQVVMMSSRIKR